MTTMIHTVPVTLILLAAAGCASHRDEGAKSVAPTAVTEQNRAQLQRLAPDASIGRVIAVLPDQRLASVGEVPVQEFARGDAMTFLGSDERPLVNGRVVEIGSDSLQVLYEAPGTSQRAPVVGDLAIRFRK